MMSPKLDVGPCLGLNICDTVTKYIPFKIFVISNSPWGVKNLSIQLISRSTLHVFWLIIVNAIQSSPWAVPDSCWWWSEALRLLLNLLLRFLQTKLLQDPWVWAYEVPNEAGSIWQYFCLFFFRDYLFCRYYLILNVPELFVFKRK